MMVTRFWPRDELIFVDGRVWGPRKPLGRPLRLVVDTGAAETIILPEILDELGYNPRDGEAITVMRSAVGHESGYLIRVEKFGCLRHQSRNLRVHAQDLPDGWNLDGLIGLNYLRQFNYEVRSQEGRICVERVQA
jgi:predicted aspartyl protease